MLILLNIVGVFNLLIPFIIALIILAYIPLLITWVILKIAKGNSHTVGTILKWNYIVFAGTIVVWGILNILASALGHGF